MNNVLRPSALRDADLPHRETGEAPCQCHLSTMGYLRWHGCEPGGSGVACHSVVEDSLQPRFNCQSSGLALL